MSTAPSVIVLDVNGTLSDLGPLAEAFTRAGLPATLTRAWFAEVLRDGFALTAAGTNPDFADLAADGLRGLLAETCGPGRYPEQVDSIMAVFRNLPLHPDAAPGLRALGCLAPLVTLSNGAPSVAESLLRRGGIRDELSRLLSVQDAPRWKPAREAYEYAAHRTGHTVGQMLLVAAHPWDIHGAGAAGLRTAWINRTGAAYPSSFARPDIEVPDLVALAGELSGP
ncbi:haloacid dehalogenase type II [Arthrobacter agilis]|uniref:haloacid dehalogenase type II n=1 Tax=Arthrobacter agilis TaxID=37921 RepID=UPI00278ABA99|nr:haloacid dehalogenase type II [Arthrobacter agilis]MDQ0736078.1 2-haloacid dehalogenase [Arthrobacter agilis]